jgi:hypothetical protein
MPWQVVDPLVIALPISIVALLVGWMLEMKVGIEEKEKTHGSSGLQE